MPAVHGFAKLQDESPLETNVTSFSFNFDLRPERIQYTLTDQGLQISMDLGAVLPRQAEILKFLEYRLQLLQGS